MNKLRILSTYFNKQKLINHTNEKVQFEWLWLTLNVTSLFLQKSLQTLFWEAENLF